MTQIHKFHRSLCITEMFILFPEGRDKKENFPIIQKFLVVFRRFIRESRFTVTLPSQLNLIKLFLDLSNVLLPFQRNSINP